MEYPRWRKPEWRKARFRRHPSVSPEVDAEIDLILSVVEERPRRPNRTHVLPRLNSPSTTNRKRFARIFLVAKALGIGWRKAAVHFNVTPPQALNAIREGPAIVAEAIQTLRDRGDLPLPSWAEAMLASRPNNPP